MARGTTPYVTTSQLRDSTPLKRVARFTLADNWWVLSLRMFGGHLAVVVVLRAGAGETGGRGIVEVSRASRHWMSCASGRSGPLPQIHPHVTRLHWTGSDDEMRRIAPKLLLAATTTITALVSPVSADSAQAEPVPHTVCTTAETLQQVTILMDPGMRLLPDGTDNEFEQGVEEPVAPCPLSLPGGWDGQFTLEDIDGEGDMACLISNTTSLEGEIDIRYSDNTTSRLEIQATTLANLTLSLQADRAVTFVGEVETGKFDGHEFRLVVLVQSPFVNQAAIECSPLDPDGLTEFAGTFTLEIGEGIL